MGAPRYLLGNALASLVLCALSMSCSTPLGWGAFSERGCSGERFSLVDAFIPTYDYVELRQTHGSGLDFTVEGRAGFEVYLKSDSCLGPVEELVRVEPNGHTQTLKRVTKPHTCVGALPPVLPGSPGT